MTTNRLAGKTALVTGAARGIGRAIAYRLAADGARVCVHYGSSVGAAEQTIAEIERSGGRAFAVQAEFGVPGDVETLMAALVAGLDGKPLDILVNNAGTAEPEATIDKATPEVFDREFAINVRAPFFLIQRALPIMSDGGRIINISSGTTWFITPGVVYSMAKGALNVLTRSLAQAVGARGITVNSVSPGVVATDRSAGMMENAEALASAKALTALGGIGQPADIADAVAFLASHDGRWITGQVLDVNGGLWLGPHSVPWQRPATKHEGRKK
jgi:NAD(P)-dependent dehydrogenase (short-subunit alcohol dehydrogenase family)